MRIKFSNDNYKLAARQLMLRIAGIIAAGRRDAIAKARAPRRLAPCGGGDSMSRAGGNEIVRIPVFMLLGHEEASQLVFQVADLRCTDLRTW